MKTRTLFTSLWAAIASIALSLIFGVVSTPAAEQYLGAEAVLRKASGEQSKPAKTESPQAKERAKLSSDIKAFQKEVGTLPADRAVTGWLELFDRFAKLSSTANNQRMGLGMEDEESVQSLSFMTLLLALPAPPAWDALAKAVEARPPGKGAAAARELGLRLLIHTLQSDEAAQKKDTATLGAMLEKANREERMQLENFYDQLNLAMTSFSGDSSPVMQSLERKLAEIESGEYGNQLEIPNLVALVGTNKAEEFLRKALVNPKAELSFYNALETESLARKLALQLLPELKTPQWELACSLDGGELYEALAKRFLKPADTNGTPARISRSMFQPGGQTQAQVYYMYGLIVHQRTKEAVAVAQELGKQQQVGYFADDALRSLERGGQGKALNNFFHELLAQNPDLPFWSQYVSIAARAGKSEEMLALIRTVIVRDDLSPTLRQEVGAHLYQALLAADKVEEGVAEIRKLLASGTNNTPEEGTMRYAERPGQLGLMLGRIGYLMKHDDWLNEGLAAARKFANPSGGRRNYYESQLTMELAGLLVQAGRGVEAEAVLTDALNRDLHKGENDGDAWQENRGGNRILTALAQLYHRAGRDADVLILLDQASAWGAKDLAEIFYTTSAMPGYMSGHGRGNDDSLGHLAAEALLTAGRTNEARKVINALLDRDPSFDPAYEVLLRFKDPDVLARLDALYARDQFEERPLIWKAHWLREAGRLEQAEAAARQAIAVDPSDGEQGPGRRMRAYAELADIREARGDKTQAEFFRGAVQAIRLSEQADQFAGAGLLSRAVKMYEESLTHFADAYCIQSRLAVRLSELGQPEAAEAHYRRAYELMPESFGRVESHCFGCEGVFQGEQAQSLAEKVFSGLAIKTPDKPQVHYLLAYLRQEQGRFKEALPELKLAVKLDRDYLNAWKHLQTVQATLHEPIAERDAVIFNIMRLDPLGRHGGESFVEVGNLRGLWEAAQAAAKLQPAEPESLYPLPASRAALEKKANEPKTRRFRSYVYTQMNESQENATPAATVSKQRIVSIVSQFLNGNLGYGGMMFE